LRFQINFTPKLNDLFISKHLLYLNMKARLFQFTIFILILSSCISNKVISHHWVDYLNASTLEPLYTGKSDNFLYNYNSQIKNISNKIIQQDSVVIITKTGKIFKGIVSKSDFDGYFIKVQNNREIYVSNIEIKTINFIKQSTEIIYDTLISNITTNPKFSSKENPQNSINKALNRKDDIWDNTNSEFESSESLATEIISEPSISTKVQEPFSVLSFVFTLLGFLTGFTFLLGLIFGAISLSNIKKNPDKFKGKGMAKFSFILSTAVISALLLLVLLIIGIFLLI